MRDTGIPDETPSPYATDVRMWGNTITWNAEVDLEIGIGHSVILRDSKEIATVPEEPKSPFGSPIFQGLQYSETPAAPLVEMTYTDENAQSGKEHEYDVISVNEVGLRSQ